MISSLPGTALAGRVYQAIPDFEDHLEHELGTWQDKWGPLYYADQHNAEGCQAPFWQQNIWLEPFRFEFDSISQASAALRGIQRNWAPPSMPPAPVLHTQFRRASLIESQLPPISRKPRPFPWQVPDAGIGAWTLLDAHTLIASPRCSSPFPAGTIEFEEDKIGPPSRAYLKLWEALVRCGTWPQRNEKCLDAGASPGGWTWALARLGAQVTAVDRAPLEDRVLAMPGVTALKHDAFTLNPEDIGPLDWLFSDVICYPPRLYEWIQKWLTSRLCKNFVCTIKMQGEADYETTQAFAEIPGGTVTHLYHNKHELTWCKINSEPMEEKNGQAKNINDD